MKLIKFVIIFFLLIPVSKSYSASHNKTKSPQRERNISLRLVYKFSIKGRVDSIFLSMAIPQTIDKRQTVTDISFSQEPTRIYTAGKNKFALFRLYDVDESFKITVKAKVTIFQSIDSAANKNSDTSLSRYLIPEPFIESNSSEIIEVAQNLKQKTDIETVMKTYFYVKDHIRYKLKEAIGAKEVLESGVGKCMDFSDLFVALLRANKIPAKSVNGMTVEYGNTPFHAWPEAYLKKQGWVQFDPTGNQSNIRQEGNNYKMNIKNKYVIFSEGRNSIGIYNYYWWADDNDKFKCKVSYDIMEE